MRKDTESKNNHQNLWRLFFVIVLGLVIASIMILLLKKSGILSKIKSVDDVREIVGKGGIFSWIVFILLQLLQTTILQFPATVVTFAGVLALGPWKAFFLSYFSIMLGSVIMFVIGRRFGKKFLIWLAGDELTNKMCTVISRSNLAFVLMMIFPFFPDDILCCVAGVGDMGFNFFFVTNLISRGLSIVLCVIVGGGIFDFSLAKLPFLIVVGVLIFTFLILVITNRNRFEKWFSKFNDKNVLKKK